MTFDAQSSTGEERSLTALSSDIQAKYDRLLRCMEGYGSVLVAFSGGLDSGLVLYAAVKALGKENVLVVTGDSESLPREELSEALRFIDNLGLTERRRVVRTEELQDERYAVNPQERCFFCKQELYGRLAALARQEGLRHVLDGCNASDVGDHRPGRRAAKLHQVQSPLLEAGLYKEEIRLIARAEGLAIWDKPQSACLASRIPYGERVTPQRLQMIEAAERFLRSRGFRQMRVRHHGQVARIELEETDLGRIQEPALREEIVQEFRRIGFLWVTLDMNPFRSGSMNVMLEEPEKEEGHG